MADHSAELLSLTSLIVTSHVENNEVAVADLPGLITATFEALSRLGEPVEPQKPEPAVSVRASIKPDYLVCLEDGAKVKMLKRYLTRFNLTPAEYREKWGLPADYPMIAPNYAEKRREIAKTIGLGRKPAVKAAAPKAPAKPRGRPKKVSTADALAAAKMRVSKPGNEPSAG